MIEVRIKLSEVDYGAAVDVLMPVLLDKLSASANPLAAFVLGKSKNLSASATKAALAVLPQETKDEIAAACLNHYSEEISRLMVELAQQKDIGIKVESVEVTAQTGD